MNAATTTSTTPAPAVKPLPSIPDYGENAIEITNLTFSYRATDSSSSYTNTSTNNPENVVLQDMNLSLPTGSRCLLIGANGSGKSVRFTFRIICLLLWFRNERGAGSFFQSMGRYFLLFLIIGVSWNIHISSHFCPFSNDT